LIVFCGLCACADAQVISDFWSKVMPIWGKHNVQIYNYGYNMKMILDKYSGSGIESYAYYMYGIVSVSLKLHPNNSAGTVTTFYMYSAGQVDNHDEIDLEFLGNATGEPYTLHTNIYANGDGAKEQQFRLWFDPSADFHNYTILWNRHHIVIYVDSIPIRVYKNYKDRGIAYPDGQQMRLLASIWNADQWATQGGSIKANWTEAPFIAEYKNLSLEGCPWRNSESLLMCTYNWEYWWNMEPYTTLTDRQKRQLKWVRKRAIIYDYCKDTRRFRGNLPPECFLPQE